MAKLQNGKEPVFTTVRVKIDTNKKLAMAVDKYNDRHPDSTLTKDEFLSLFLDYCHKFGIDIDEAEKPLTAMNKLRSSVKSFNDSAWAAKKEMEKFVLEQKTRTDKIIAAEKEVCDTLAELVGDTNFSQAVLHPITRDLLQIKADLQKMQNIDISIRTKDKQNGEIRNWTFSESFIELLNKLINIQNSIIKLQAQLINHTKDREKPTILDRIEHIENLLSTMKMRGRLYGWEEIK